jgi:triacylglycerol lipase
LSRDFGHESKQELEVKRRTAPRRWFAIFAVLLVSCATAGQGVNQSSQPTVASLNGDGAYEVRSYTDFPDVPEFARGTIYYPVGAAMPIGGVAISPGYTETQRHIYWWGPRLASHGYAVLVLDTNDRRRDEPEERAEALIAAVRILRAENDRGDSPLRGRIDGGKMAVMGHSKGGGGALVAANEYPDEIQAAIPYTPWQPEGDFSRITVPTLLMAGSADRVARVVDHAWPHFLSISESTTRVYMEVDDGDHYIADSTRGRDLATIGRYAIAWLKLYLDGDERYRGFIYGEEAEADREKFSRYLTYP